MNNLYPQVSTIQRTQRQEQLGQKAKLIWFTGLSGSGKSTIASLLEKELFQRGFKTYLLDGDNVRTGLNKDLTFSNQDRAENIRRIGEVSGLFLDAGIVVLSAFISPFNAERNKVRDIVGAENYLEVFMDTPLEVCEQRDVKGLYKKARAGNLKNFTGIDSPYEKPENPGIIISTHTMSIDKSLHLLLNWIEPKLVFKNVYSESKMIT